jgi:hypothetical protein
MEFGSWKKDLTSVMPHLQRVALGEKKVSVLALNERVALGLPSDRNLAAEVVKLFRPMKGKACFAASCIESLSRMGVAPLMGSSFKGNFRGEISWLEDCESIGFLGCNPGHGLRCVLLSRDSSKEFVVTKLAVEGAHQDVAEEAKKLMQFSQKFEGVPEVISLESGDDWSAFSMRHLKDRGPMRLDQDSVIGLLDGWLEEEFISPVSLPWVNSILQKAPVKLAAAIAEQKVRRSLLHGDFAPWNLRSDRGKLMAIDWEWGSLDGLGGIDLGHGLLMTGNLVDELRGGELIESVVTHVGAGPLKRYLENCGWENPNAWLGLALLYSGSQANLETKDELKYLESRL